MAAHHCILRFRDITFRDSGAKSIYSNIQGEVDSNPEMHPTVIAHMTALRTFQIFLQQSVFIPDLSNSYIIYPCVVFFSIWIVAIMVHFFNIYKFNGTLQWALDVGGHHLTDLDVFT